MFPVVPVEYCVLCGVWYSSRVASSTPGSNHLLRISDFDGDGQTLEIHHLAHYADRFNRFSVRPPQGTEVSFEPIGIVEGPDYIEYEHGTGFDGHLPEFHANIANGVVHMPGFCPWCVFDTESDMVKRLHQ